MDITITHTASDAPPLVAARYVFVYGTLRLGEDRDINRLLPAPIFMGTSRVEGTLYHLGACNYPGLRLGGTTWVQGDVYQITPELERQLDEIEQVWPVESAEYSRKDIRILVRQDAGAAVELTCLTYEISEECAEAGTVIASGNWLDRQSPMKS